jgi:diguanylate cyclase (GGDEF)-like protein
LQLPPFQDAQIKRIKAMSKSATLGWIALLISLREIFNWIGIESAYDLVGLLMSTGLFGVIWYRLGSGGELRPFMIGIGCYWVASVLDWSEVYFPFPALVDQIDDMLFFIGFFLTGVSFLNVMLAQKKLQQQLLQQAYSDDLTQLANRRALFVDLAKRLREKSGAILYIDVNNFKAVNDRYGHDVGDQVLCKIARILQSAAPYAYRIGGDEFVIVMDNPDLVEPQIAYLHEQVAPLTAQYGISLSIGTAHFQAGMLHHPDALLAQADQQMYKAKMNFRSRSREA